MQFKSIAECSSAILLTFIDLSLALTLLFCLLLRSSLRQILLYYTNIQLILEKQTTPINQTSMQTKLICTFIKGFSLQTNLLPKPFLI